MRVLVVEDEPKMAALLARGLREEGHAADVAGTGEDALWMARAVDYDAIVLDVMLPGIDGFETCRSLRGAEVWSPVLMLTARDAVDDRITGLDVGADDYLLKPFSFGELLARLRALVRRVPARAAGRGRGRGSCGSIPRSGGSGADGDEVEPLREGVRAARGVHAAAGRGASPAGSCSRPRGTSRSRAGRTSSTSTFATLREQLGADTIETVRGVGYRLRAGTA